MLHIDNCSELVELDKPELAQIAYLSGFSTILDR